jgi:hypothetical protein
VACYEKSTLRGGAKAFIKNSILSECFESGISFDSKSEIEVSYSLSDREVIPGEGNLNQSPELVHPSTGNFELSQNSPCIDSGDPLSPTDPDGSIADMGAYYTHTGNSGLTIHINEFSYHDPFNYPTGDWVELYNRTSQPIQLAGWHLTHGIFEFTITDSILIEPNAFLVICQDRDRFSSQFPDAIDVAGDFHFNLSNKSGKIALMNPNGRLVHSVRYADYRPWPPLADGQGATVELEQNQEGHTPYEWRESHRLLGTPGAPNSLPTNVSGIFINEVMASNSSAFADEQGEFDDWFELYNASEDSVNVAGLSFTDNSNDASQWQLPLNYPGQTTIPPHGYLVIWADEDSDQGPLHADFKLSAQGEMLAVYQRDGLAYSERERLDFGPQITDITFGRIPDGGTLLQYMYPTPGASNTVNGISDRVIRDIVLFPNPFKQLVTIEAVNVSKPYQVLVTDMLGQVMISENKLVQSQFSLNTESWSSGIYNVIITDAEGKIYSAKAIAQ